MEPRFKAGDPVQTPLGKGTVREVRGSDRLVVEIKGRSVIFAESDVAPLDTRRRTKRAGASRPGPPEPSSRKSAHDGSTAVDLHGLTVEEALVRAEEALNDALLADHSGLRFIHGQSSHRICHALHRWLERMPAVRGFHLDPQNPGVTVVTL